MILTTCAACAAPLAHDAPRCVRCKLRYCNASCQHDHWRRGHKQMCKKIHRGGNAEQYNADKKYKEAVAVAVEDHSITLSLRETTADATSGLGGEANLRETIAIYEDLVTRSRRVLGTSHPTTQQREQCLREFRAFLTGGVAAVLAERRARGGATGGA